MKYITFEKSDTYPIIILVKPNALNQMELLDYYIKDLELQNVSRDQIAIIALEYNDAGKAPVKLMKEFLNKLLPQLESIGAEHIYCADAGYYKVLSGNKKADIHLGYSFPCAINDYEHINILLGINHKSLIYNPNNKDKLKRSLDALVLAIQGQTVSTGKSIVTSASYPSETDQIKNVLQNLLEIPELSVDIEGYSLNHWEAGVATISFSWNKSEGVAFPITHDSLLPSANAIVNLRKLALKRFFELYKGKLKFHRANYDIKVLIYTLFMTDHIDHHGMLKGLECLTRNFDDTRIIAYLALNTTADLNLSLKALAHEYAGNYALDVTDISKIPLSQLLEYNLIDTCSTNYVYDKYYPLMVADDQLEIYQNVMLPSLKTIIQMELEGMPLNPKRVIEVEDELKAIRQTNLDIILNSILVTNASNIIVNHKLEKDYEDRKNKAKNPDKIQKKDISHWDLFQFNPNSNKQIQTLLFDVMSLPVLEKTKTKQPSTGADVLEKLINHTKDKEYKELIQALIEYGKAEKILSTFIAAFKKAIKHDGFSDIVYLHGSFNLGGTLSGRLSSSDPNLQNLPATSKYGKLIKSCFEAPDGWIFAGADSNSLEDMISALTTKDPNKLKVYEDGYDGHSLRAFSYFPDELPDIVDTVESINSIKTKYPDIRQASKDPTFALTYGGKFYTLMKNCGFSENQAKLIESSYHELYKVSDEWVQDKLNKASTDGYVTGAFGLKLRTPLLHSTIRGNKATPYEAEAEGRSAGNMLGQSYCLLNCHAANNFMKRVWNSKHKHNIKIIAQIHDAIYLLIRDQMEVITWVNKNLIECMQWQELDEIKHGTVKLGAELDLHYKSWDKPITIPNNASSSDIQDICREKQKEFKTADLIGI